MEPANRKLIRPSFNEAKAEAKGQRPSQPRGGPKQTSPPEQTNAENFYYLKQMQSKTSMSLVLRDGEVLKGVVLKAWQTSTISGRFRFVAQITRTSVRIVSVPLKRSNCFT